MQELRTEAGVSGKSERAGETLGVEHSDGFFQLLAGHADGGDEVRITRDDDGGIILIQRNGVSLRAL